jgi:predicted O-methyltransferase YrrM
MLKQVVLSPDLCRYVIDMGTRETAVQRRLREETATMPHANLQSGADQAQLMTFLVQTIGARRALEIGTFRGYGALAIAMGLPPDGKLVACDLSKEWTDEAQPFWQQAGVRSRIEVRLGQALETLDELIVGEADKFDFAFIDADKENYDAYYERCLVLVRRGGIIALDNVLWKGAVADPEDRSADTLALRAINRKIHDDARVDMCLLPISDGLTLVRRR